MLSYENAYVLGMSSNGLAHPFRSPCAALVDLFSINANGIRGRDAQADPVPLNGNNRYADASFNDNGFACAPCKYEHDVCPPCGWNRVKIVAFCLSGSVGS